MLLLIGLYGMLAQRNLVKKLMAMNILQVAVILFFVALAEKTGATAPIEVKGVHDVSAYINPLPHALMLTAIVVGRQHHGRCPGPAHPHPPAFRHPGGA